MKNRKLNKWIAFILSVLLIVEVIPLQSFATENMESKKSAET